MCGIVGILAAGASADTVSKDVRRMADVLSHRGPDGSGVWADRGIGLGHRRLSIIDHAGGVQPFLSRDARYVLTFNGEIYNYRAIRTRLESLGHRFRTASDTEVLLQAWERWGSDAVASFEGMFAFAVWDNHSRTLHLVRDRMGIKPLYYARGTSACLLFASELKGLCVSRFFQQRTPRRDAIVDYFRLGYLPLDKCIYEEATKVLPGEIVSIDEATGRLRRTRYWQPSIVARTDGEASLRPEELWERLKDVVEKQSVADVPIATFLSGGIDSSSITAALASASEQAVTAYTMQIDAAGHDETSIARSLARHYDIDHRIEPVSIDNCSSPASLAGIYDEPFADSSSIPTVALCRYVAQGHKVALSGDGGDETFLGYPWYGSYARRRRVAGLLGDKAMRNLASAAFGVARLLANFRLKMPALGTLAALSRDAAGDYLTGQSLDPCVSAQSVLSDELRRGVQDYDTVELFQDTLENVAGDDPYAIGQYLDLHFYLPGDILTKVDRASMASSLEARVPFLDDEIVELALSLQVSNLRHLGKRKGLLVSALEPNAPDGLTRHPKRGFSVPLAAWFRSELGDLVRDRLDSGGFDDRGLLSSRSIRRMLADHTSGRADRSQMLWAVLMFDASAEYLDLSC